MRTVALLLGGAALLGFAAQTPNLPTPLSNNLAKLSSATTVEVKYTFRTLGESPTDYKLSLGRPKMFKLASDSGFVLSDGKTLYTYTKATNSYTQAPLTDEALMEFAGKPEVFAWAPFLMKDPASAIAAAKAGASRTVQGNEVTEVEVTMKKGSTVATLFLDKKVGIARGFSLKSGEKQYLAAATELAVKTGAKDEAADSSAFAFTAPEGSKKAEAPKPGASYAQVQAILNDSCMPCHSAGNRKGGFDFTNYDGVIAAVTPGNAAASRLIQSLHAPGASRMPKGRAPLSEVSEATIAAWINAGAKKD